MVGEGSVSLESHFSILEDTRDPLRRCHLLIDILMIAIAAVLCGADGWSEIEALSIRAATGCWENSTVSPK
jgi:hypothetical protein